MALNVFYLTNSIESYVHTELIVVTGMVVMKCVVVKAIEMY